MEACTGWHGVSSVTCVCLSQGGGGDVASVYLYYSSLLLTFPVAGPVIWHCLPDSDFAPSPSTPI